MAKERTITTKIMEYLRARGAFVWKQHGGPMQMRGLPDVMAVLGGRLYAFEVKTEHGRTTKIQEKRIEDLRKAGATAAVVRSLSEVAEHIDTPLK